MKKSFLLILFLTLFFIPKDTFAMSTNTFTMNRNRYIGSGSSWTYPSVQQFTHFGSTYQGFTTTANITRSTFYVNFNDDFNGKTIDLNFYLYYSNLIGNGENPTIQINGNFGKVTPIGSYVDPDLTTNMDLCKAYGNHTVPCVWAGQTGSELITGADKLTIQGDPSKVGVYTVEFTNLKIEDATNTMIEVLTSYENAKNSTGEYSISTRYYYDFPINQQIVTEQQQTNEKLDKTNENLDKLNENITNDDTTESNENASNFFSGVESNNHGLSGLITQPLNFLRSLTGTTCQPLQFELPFVQKQVSLPCMKGIYQEYFGVFFTLYQMLTTGIIAYSVGIRLLGRIKGLQDPQNDRIEVFNL